MVAPAGHSQITSLIGSLMFRFEDVQRQLDQVTARDIDSFPVFRLPGDLPLSVAWDRIQPDALDYDVVMLDGGERLARRDPSWQRSEKTVASVAEPVSTIETVAEDESLQRVLEILNAHPYCVCQRDGDVGVITVADLTRPEVTLVTLAAVLSMDASLQRLVPTLSDGRWRDLLSQDRRRGLDAEVDRRRKNNALLTEEDCLPFSIWVSLGKTVVRPHLSEAGGRRWDRSASSLAKHRNDIAHARPPRSGSLAQRSLDAIHLSRELHDLSLEPPGIWSTYLRTECTAFWDGSMLPIAARPAAHPVCWMLSAQNPHERRLPAKANAARHDTLLGQLRARGDLLTTGVGRAPGPSEGWSEDMAVTSGGREQALEYSHRFGQRALFEFEGDEMRVLQVDTGQVREKRPLR